MMDPALKAKWVAALRSGEFVQGHGRLYRMEDGQKQFCCLGVLCKVASLSTVGEQRQGFQLGPIQLGKVALTNTEQQQLINLNDYDGKPFSDIADHIEANL